MLAVAFLITTLVHQILAQTNEGVFDPRCPSIEDPLRTVHLPHESNCGAFYKCNHGYRYLILCPTGTHFSVEHDRCEWPWLANCDPALLPPLPEAACPAIDNPNVLVFVPDTSRCDSYFLCFNGRRIQRKCSDGLHWDAARRWCDFARNVPC